MSITGAPNFSYKEFVKSDIAIRRGISNIPNDAYCKNIEKLAVNILQPLRDAYGRIRITSGYRCKKLNKIIHGSRRSFHCVGCAADIEPLNKEISLFDVLFWINKNCEFQELIAEYFQDGWGWVHVAYVEGRNEKLIKLKDKEHNYEVVTIDYLMSLWW